MLGHFGEVCYSCALSIEIERTMLMMMPIAPIPKAANWAVGTFIFAGIANYEFCLYRRRLEKAHMKRAVEIIDRKKAEKEAAAQTKRVERRKAKEEADKLAEEAKKKSWKFW